MHSHKTNSVNFAVRIEGVSGPDTLRLPDGTTAPAPISPGVLVVATTDRVVFKPGMAAGRNGLQQLAEDGNPCPLIEHLASEAGVSSAEFIIPNLRYRITARPGDRLHFAVMFVQSNDLFYAFGPGGLALFDDDRQPISGNVTSHVELWDAGTELNEAPGVGAGQAPRQSRPGAGTKTREPVRRICDVDDGFHYPPVDKVIRVSVAPEAG